LVVPSINLKTTEEAINMTIIDQYGIAEETRDFLAQWGLKKKYVAKVCQIPEGVFSKFLNNKIALSPNQLGRVTAYTSDYARRNS